jgi:hypothetical protein
MNHGVRPDFPPVHSRGAVDLSAQVVQVLTEEGHVGFPADRRGDVLVQGLRGRRGGWEGSADELGVRGVSLCPDESF